MLKLSGAGFGFNMISAVSSEGQLRLMVVPGKVAAAQFCEFLRRLVYKAPRPIFLFLDGHPVHRSAKVQNFGKSVDGKLELYFLPPYSPELNPDENVWNELMNNGVGRMAIIGSDDLKHKVIDYLKQMQLFPDLIRSFFQSPTTLMPQKYDYIHMSRIVIEDRFMNNHGSIYALYILCRFEIGIDV